MYKKQKRKIAYRWMSFPPFKRDLQTRLEECGHVTLSGLRFSTENLMLIKLSNNYLKHGSYNLEKVLNFSGLFEKSLKLTAFSTPDTIFCKI